MKTLSRLLRQPLLLGVVLLPMLMGCIYYLLLAQDRYVSTSVLTVRRANQDGVAAGGLAMLIGGATGYAREETLYLADYIHSLGLLRKLDATLKLRAHFESAGADPFYRLWPQASQEWMLEYWRSRVEVMLDEQSGLVHVRVQGFDPTYAQRVNTALLAECEAFVNAISQRIAREQMGFVQGELDRAEDKLQVARTALLGFQTTHQVLDPLAQAQASNALGAELRGQLAKVEAEHNTKRAYLNEDAPDLVALRNQAAALKLQIAREARSATRPDNGALNQLTMQFHELKSRASFAEDAYKTALAAVESTRVEAGRKVKSLVVVEPPTLPQLAEYPRRLYELATLLVAALLVYALVRLSAAVVNEHRD